MLRQLEDRTTSSLDCMASTAGTTSHSYTSTIVAPHHFFLLPDYNIWEKLKKLGCFEYIDGHYCLIDPDSRTRPLVEVATVEEMMLFLVKKGIPNEHILSTTERSEIQAQVKIAAMNHSDLRSAQLQLDGVTSDELVILSDRVIRAVLKATGFSFESQGILAPDRRTLLDSLDDVVRYVRTHQTLGDSSSQSQVLDATAATRRPSMENLLIKKRRELAIRIWAASSSVPLPCFDWDAARQYAAEAHALKAEIKSRQQPHRHEQYNGDAKVSQCQLKNDTIQQSADSASLKSAESSSLNGKRTSNDENQVPPSSSPEDAPRRQRSKSKATTKTSSRKASSKKNRIKGSNKAEPCSEISKRIEEKTENLLYQLTAKLKRLNKTKKKRGLEPTLVASCSEKSIESIRQAIDQAEKDLKHDDDERSRLLQLEDKIDSELSVLVALNSSLDKIDSELSVLVALNS